MKTKLQIFAVALISTACLSPVAADETNETNETIYFLVAAPGPVPGTYLNNDSYLLPLSKQEDIDHARFLISLGRSVFSEAHQTIVGARVGPGKDGINRNYLDPKFPEWSWHVVEFFEFGDYSIEILDGGPSGVETDPDWYMADPDGRHGLIAFWQYTVVRELGSVPLYLSIVPDGQNLQFYWSGVGTNYVYTFEGKESLASPNWLAIPGGSWPLKTNQWTLPRTNATARFYRVRAEQTQQ